MKGVMTLAARKRSGRGKVLSLAMSATNISNVKESLGRSRKARSFLGVLRASFMGMGSASFQGQGGTKILLVPFRPLLPCKGRGQGSKRERRKEIERNAEIFRLGISWFLPDPDPSLASTLALDAQATCGHVHRLIRAFDSRLCRQLHDDLRKPGFAVRKELVEKFSSCAPFIVMTTDLRSIGQPETQG